MKKLIVLIVLFSFIFVLSSATLQTVGNAKQVIYLDAGHGGADGGAVAKSGSYEKDINLSITLYLKKILEEVGFEVLLTRDGDYDLAPLKSNNRKREDIHKRVQLINSSSCILYISIHTNTYSSEKIYGAQVFYNKYNKNNELLANCIQEAIIYQLQNTTRSAKSITGKYLIDNASKVGCLVEVGFLSNPNELKLLDDPKYQEKMAYAISSGILEYLKK